MKIRNLYVGEVRQVIKITNINYSTTCFTSRLLRHTILERKNSNSNIVNDIIYGGNYEISDGNVYSIGYEFATCLDQQEILKELKDYKKTNINKRKLMKLLSSYTNGNK